MEHRRAASAASFCIFASGAVLPVLPHLFGLPGTTAVIVAAEATYAPDLLLGTTVA